VNWEYEFAPCRKRGGDYRCQRQVWYNLEITYFLYHLASVLQGFCVKFKGKKSGIIDRMSLKTLYECGQSRALFIDWQGIDQLTLDNAGEEKSKR
jgi:hypothetical protein